MNKFHKTGCLRRKSGFSLVEMACSLAFIMPLTFCIIFSAVEAYQYFWISQALQQGARESARRLATTYAVDPGIISNVGDQFRYGFDPVRVPAVINDSSQFSARFNSGSPASVTVTTTFLSGRVGLPEFPQFDPLGLGHNRVLQASSTYQLE
jgi:hypothetical protein